MKPLPLSKPSPIHAHYVRQLFARARKNLHSAHAFKCLGAHEIAQVRLEWFHEDFEAARAQHRELRREAELEALGLFVRVEPYVKVVGFRPLESR